MKRYLTFVLSLLTIAPPVNGQITAAPAPPRAAIQRWPAPLPDDRPPIALFADNPALKPAVSIPVEYAHARSITLKPDALPSLPSGSRIELAPEPGITDVWQVASISKPSRHVRIVRCTHTTDPSAYLVFCTYRDATAMTMQVPSRNATYRLQFREGVSYDVWKLDSTKVMPETDAHEPLQAEVTPPRGAHDDDWLPPTNPYSPRVTSGCTGAAPVIDIMIVYTPLARDLIGGTNAMRAECILAVDHTNTAYRNSDMSAQMRLVYCDLINYEDTGNHHIDLPRLRNPTDGYLDEVHALRDALNADLVSMVSNAGTGIAYCPPNAPTYASHAFSTCRWTRVAATYTLAHETGHNLGAGHDVNGGGPCGPNWWAIGFVFGPPESTWCTVMAFADVGVTRVLHYSNPNITFNGYPTGSPIGAPDEAHNQQLMIQNDDVIEAFELTRYDVYVDFDFGGVGVGSPANPYSTVASGAAAIAVPATGATDTPRLYMSTGSTSFTGTISKNMQLRPCDGPVTLGVTP